LALLDVMSRVRGKAPSTGSMTIWEAKAALWRALADGHLIAVGLKADGSIVEIPALEWAQLRLFNIRGRDILRYAHSKIEPFIEVTLRQSDLLRLWPATGGFPTLPASKIDKGGRPPEYDWAALKDIFLQIVEKHGKPDRNNKRLPTKAQLVEQIQTKYAARFDREPPVSSLRSHVNQWLADMGEN
jgi:hypothetical protein